MADLLDLHSTVKTETAGAVSAPAESAYAFTTTGNEKLTSKAAILRHLAKQAESSKFASYYTSVEPKKQAQVDAWLQFAENPQNVQSFLKALDAHLQTRQFVGETDSVSIADVALVIELVRLVLSKTDVPDVAAMPVCVFPPPPAGKKKIIEIPADSLVVTGPLARWLARCLEQAPGMRESLQKNVLDK